MEHVLPAGFSSASELYGPMAETVHLPYFYQLNSMPSHMTFFMRLLVSKPKRAKGNVTVAIDDFGTGDANLMEMSRMEADIIKLDKYFIDQITSEQKVPRIVKGLIAFAEAMEFEVIAEGVETEMQANVLRSLNVDMAQGWFFSKPLGAKAFMDFAEQCSSGAPA